MNDNLFRVFAVIIFVVGAGISIYHRRKADREAGKVSLQAEGLISAIILRVFGLGVWGGVFAWMLNPSWMAWSQFDLPDWMRWLGLFFGAAGDALAWWTFTNLKNNITPTVVTRAQAHLVTSGPYRWIRHPLYLMGLIGYTGFALLAENWFIALMSLLTFAAIAVRTGKEEARLMEKFGEEYRQYAARTGRFFPKLS